MAKIIIHSFGYRHGLPDVDSSRIFDVSNIDINNHQAYHKALFDLHRSIRSIVVDDERLYTNAEDDSELLDFHFYIGCECGHHKSVKVSEFIAEDISEIGLHIWSSELCHRDIDKPLVDVIPKRLFKKKKKDTRKRQCSCGENF